ncbi:endothelin-converting enzyme 1, partial [Caerostris darwini]
SLYPVTGSIEDGSVKVLLELLTDYGIGEWPILNHQWDKPKVDLEWRLAMLHVHQVQPFFHTFVAPDDRNSSVYLLHVYSGSPILNTQYYLNTSDPDYVRYILSYKNLIGETVRLLKAQESIVKRDIEDLLEFEVEFANSTCMEIGIKIINLLNILGTGERELIFLYWIRVPYTAVKRKLTIILQHAMIHVNCYPRQNRKGLFEKIASGLSDVFRLKVESFLLGTILIIIFEYPGHNSLSCLKPFHSATIALKLVVRSFRSHHKPHSPLKIPNTIIIAVHRNCNRNPSFAVPSDGHRSKSPLPAHYPQSYYLTSIRSRHYRFEIRPFLIHPKPRSPLKSPNTIIIAVHRNRNPSFARPSDRHRSKSPLRAHYPQSHYLTSIRLRNYRFETHPFGSHPKSRSPLKSPNTIIIAVHRNCNRNPSFAQPLDGHRSKSPLRAHYSQSYYLTSIRSVIVRRTVRTQMSDNLKFKYMKA